MTTVLISGLGLIGSSLARVMKKSDVQPTILGDDPNDDTSQFLLGQGIIDERVKLLKAASRADIILLAGPVSVIIDQLAQLTDVDLKPDVLVTDVGSTKTQVMAASQALQQRHVAFMGGHPMAGSHQAGGRFGRADLFDHATYFIVDGSQTLAQAAQFKACLQPARLRWVNVTAKAHDGLVSEISHVPHVLAANLVNTADHQLKHDSVGLSAAAGGFKSTTRIAGADPTMWTAIMLSNSDAISEQLTTYMTQLKQIQDAIDVHDTDKIYQFFAHAKSVRERLDQGGEKQ
ncbi:prephenate dehydrogenase/arogenate dehydrogenase family protein [Lactobacillus sp. LC28-10]|uniref:Prephenate dehydrogenase/arogenate dehydrogenase family protein n=1 Tax=Secundilactobacillus angelensis TaxID=2722706 RepID=A0ABX1KZP3_9LACO|nr:prephenate dehydrogenase/arogenate dehydrogenase family protein [Secundilactobacillus angelensis]MCH5463373.1 prephenate dehydrogenase/arogenate dehydrogenase family protein [Secundilactobacillus angelensis]NLR19406.1 prephenate dehydrogenase/arogenate dehydrogenase family protein [Secundilactobacillus angelensis]